MNISLFLSFVATSIFMIFMPGPDNISILLESITKGKKNAIFLSIGMCAGVLIHTIAAATGMSLIIQNSAFAFKLVKYLGALYLIYVAVMALREKRLDLSLNNNIQNVRISQQLKKGFFMNLLNPKVSLFFIAFLPQFITKSGYDLNVQMIILGISFMFLSLISFTFISVLSQKLNKHLHNDKFWKTTKFGKSIVMGILGLSLAFSEK